MTNNKDVSFVHDMLELLTDIIYQVTDHFK